MYHWFQTNYRYFLRQTESQKPKSSEQTSSGQSPCSLILRAEPTVASILKVKNTTVFKTGFKTEIKIKPIQATSCKSACSNYVYVSSCWILAVYNIAHYFFQTLDADYSKNQEALLGVLHHMLSGKSFELILAAAAATGKLQSFVVKLIK